MEIDTTINKINDIFNNEKKDNKADNKAKNLGKELGKDEFLKLLITQLRYQDPLEPMKDKEFVSQMAQFSSLEQMSNLNNSFSSFVNKQANLNDTISNLNSSLERLQILPILGKQIDAVNDKETISGKVEKISFKNGLPKVYVSGKEISIDSIMEIRV
ncbi:MAG: flagellar hook capping FlgD N-terminal domain-containing protein [bacterium]|nr:flagellar hook capping FlgD N-terminal domain-containing protein [bacterium]